MRDALQTYLNAKRGSAIEQLAEAVLSRDGELEQQLETGSRHALMAHAEKLEAAAGEVQTDLTDYTSRANVRAVLADYIEEKIWPASADAHLRKLPEKLRQARQQCWFQLDTNDGRTRMLWDHKAGEPLLCPDDAREEGMRLQRRLEGRLEELERQGLRVYFGVLTIENAQPGGLQSRIDKLWRKLRRAIKARVPYREGLSRKAKERPKLFPIEGAIAVLEAPLSESRTWHPHLNVIFVTRGFFDWEKWWSHWQCVSDFQKLERGNVAAAFRELIKYAVRAVPEKSAAKQQQSSPARSSSDTSPDDSSKSRSSGRSICGSEPPGAGVSDTSARSSSTDRRRGRGEHRPGPSMIEWTAAEWLEWWQAMKGRRRTRTYGQLYGLNVDPELPEGAWITIGKARWTGSAFAAWFPLLESIPGDKSILNIRTRYEKWLQGLTDPPERYRRLHEQLLTARQRLEFLGLSR